MRAHSAVASISDGGAAKGVDRVVTSAGSDRLLPSVVPLGGIAEAHIAGGDRTCEEERDNRHDNQRAQLENLAVDERGALDGFAGG